MSTVALCRVCLASNTKMHHIANTPYQEIFEKLATELCTIDGRPETVCWVCLSALQHGRRLADTARAAHEIITQLSLSGIQLNEDTVSILDRNFVRKLAWTPIQTQSINKGYKNSPTKVEIKQEPENDLNNLELCDETQVEMNNTQVLLLTHIEMDQAQEKQTGSQEIHTGCQTIYNTKVEQLSYDEVSEPNCSENTFSEIQTGTLLTDIEKSVKKKKRKNVVVMALRKKRSWSPRTMKIAVKAVQDGAKLRRTAALYNIPVSTLSEYVKESRNCCTIKFHKMGRKPVFTEQQEKAITEQILVTGEPSRNFCCETCGKAFYTKSTLKEHRLTHSELKRFSCDHCPAKFSKRIDIERHMMIHTGQKPFQCDVCRLKFNRKYNMLLHILTHADNRPFICQICNMSFSRKYDLTRHTKRKNMCEKSYACDLCEFESVNVGYLKTHTANKHLKLKGEKPYKYNRHAI